MTALKDLKMFENRWKKEITPNFKWLIIIFKLIFGVIRYMGDNLLLVEI